jgi:hypothetical protein
MYKGRAIKLALALGPLMIYCAYIIEILMASLFASMSTSFNICISASYAFFFRSLLLHSNDSLFYKQEQLLDKSVNSVTNSCKPMGCLPIGLQWAVPMSLCVPQAWCKVRFRFFFPCKQTSETLIYTQFYLNRQWSRCEFVEQALNVWAA